MKQLNLPERITSIAFYYPFIILFLAYVLWPNFCFADDLMGGIRDGDYSIRFLSNIFGVVDGVLHGSGSQIFGAMFSVFNSAVLTLGTTILGYTLFVSTLRTAHEGEALGRNWSSMWIPFKSAMGFALMLPKATGYSMIQIFTMWVVVQGVGAANLIWDTALDYLNSGGAVIQPNTPSLKGSVTLAGDILKAETCMFMLEQTLVEEQKAQKKANPTADLLPIPSFADTVTTPTKDNQALFSGDSPIIQFPGKLKAADGDAYNDNKYEGICGQVKWTVSSQTPTEKQLGDARSLAVQQVITDLVPYAQQIGKDYGPPMLGGSGSVLNPTTGTLSKTILRDAGNDYEGIVGPAVNLMKNTIRSPFGLTSFVNDAKNNGWIMAGSYYQQLITLNRNYATMEKAYPSFSFDKFTSNSADLPQAMQVPELTRIKDFFGEALEKSDLKKYIQKQVDSATTSNGEGKAFFIGAYDIIGGVGGQFLAIFTSGLSSIIQGYIELWGNQGAEDSVGVMNPVTSAATLGSGLVSLVASIWVGGMIAVFGIGTVGSFCSAINPIGYGIINSLNWFMPMLSVLMVTMLVLGATLAYYLPIVPYILFLFGGLGWIIGVIEAMAAAPLVALGIAHPEDHEILGKAQPAVMLLANIFIRPSLMVIGFIGGISLSYVGVWLLNAGFARASVAMTAGTQGWAWVFMPLALMSIYTALIVQIINQSFGLIHILPDEVLRWIGGGGKQFGEGQSEQAVRGAFKGDMEAFGKGISGSASSLSETADKNKKKEDDAGANPPNAGIANTPPTHNNPP